MSNYYDQEIEYYACNDELFYTEYVCRRSSRKASLSVVYSVLTFSD